MGLPPTGEDGNNEEGDGCVVKRWSFKLYKL